MISGSESVLDFGTGSIHSRTESVFVFGTESVLVSGTESVPTVIFSLTLVFSTAWVWDGTRPRIWDGMRPKIWDAFQKKSKGFFELSAPMFFSSFIFWARFRTAGRVHCCRHAAAFGRRGPHCKCNRSTPARLHWPALRIRPRQARGVHALVYTTAHVTK